jgi:UDP-glucose 4-epimerase
MRAFITGGAGFIGSHLADALIARGDNVVILDNLSTGSIENIAQISSKVNFFEGDIRDQKLVEKLTEGSDLVLHMAAALGVQTIMNHTVEAVATNFTGSEVVMNAALKFDKRLIIASTSEIYGKNPKQPLSEIDDRVVGTPQKIRWTYADAKALEEAIAYVLFTTHGLKQTTLRFFNTVGPRQTGRYGMVVPRFIQAALNGEPIPVHGDGTQSRVFCHVEDVVRAVLLVINDETTIGEVFNVGGIGETSIKQLAEKIIAHTNTTSTISFTPYSEAYPLGYEDMQRRVPDTTKLRTHIGWQPVHTLDSIIEDVAADKRSYNLTRDREHP